MLSIKIKDIKNRQNFYKNELLKTQIKFIFKNLLNNSIKKGEYKMHSVLLCSFLKMSLIRISKTKIKRRCILNNRSRTSTRKFGISRTIFRELLQFGVIPGFVKAVW